MHQTTIRFDSDLWVALAAAAARDGISVAQYVRESAVARLARETEVPFVALTDRAAAGRRDANLQREPSAAVWAQSRLARARAQEVREHAHRLREARSAAAAARA